MVSASVVGGAAAHLHRALMGCGARTLEKSEPGTNLSAPVFVTSASGVGVDEGVIVRRRGRHERSVDGRQPMTKEGSQRGLEAICASLE